MATRENGKLAKKQRDCPKLLGKVGPFLANFILGYLQKLLLFTFLTTFYLSYLIRVQETHNTGLGVYCGDESYLNRKAIFGKNSDFLLFFR